jgi:hypothetical protein
MIKRISIYIFFVITLIAIGSTLLSTNRMLFSIYDSLFAQSAPLRIYNAGDSNNSVLPVLVGEGLKAVNIDKSRNPKYLEKLGGGSGAEITLPLDSSWTKTFIKIRASGSGQLIFELKGPAKWLQDSCYPVWVDYRKLSVNDDVLVPEQVSVSFAKDLRKLVPVHDGDDITLSLEIRKHKFRFSDLRHYGLSNTLLFVIVIFSLALGYKLNNWVLKIPNKIYLLDLCFISVFAVLLVIPVSSLDSSENNNSENRRLSRWPSLVINGVYNFNFGREFDSWFNDRFNLRAQAISLNAQLLRKINRTTVMGGVVYDKQSQWMFNLSQIDNRNIAPNIQDKVIESLKEFNDFLSSNNIKFYVMVVPSKADVYRKDLNFYKTVQGVQYESLINRLTSQKDYPFIFLYDELAEGAKSDYVFFKTDHHWTDWGSYLGYKALMKRVKEDFNNATSASTEDFKKYQSYLVRSDWDRSFHRGVTTGALRMSAIPYSDFLKTSYTYYDPINEPEFSIDKEGPFQFKHFKNKKIGNFRAIFCGTSMNEDLMQFVPQSFSDLLYIRINENGLKMSVTDRCKVFKLYKNKILSFKPDIFVLTIHAEALPYMIHIMKQ